MQITHTAFVVVFVILGYTGRIISYRGCSCEFGTPTYTYGNDRTPDLVLCLIDSFLRSLVLNTHSLTHFYAFGATIDRLIDYLFIWLRCAYYEK